MGKLNGKWALVTGSSRGIGQQVLLALGREGCNVIVHGRKLENTRATLDMAQALGVETLAVSGDIGTEEGCAEIVRGVENGPGHVDILYNNAAVMGPMRSLWEFTTEDWLNVMVSNLLGMVRLCKALAPGMKERGWGRIVNVTSGIGNEPAQGPYGVSKAAVDKYSRCLAQELQGSGVLVNYLDPGWLRTDMGGPQAPGSVESVLPGAMVPVLLDDDGPTGQLFSAQDFAEGGRGHQ